MIILDGPIGTELQRHGVSLEGTAWSAMALVSYPDLISQIHRDYRNAGADILTTNTFRTHDQNLIGTSLENRGEELTQLAVQLTKQVAREIAGNPLRVAGSLSPLGDCYDATLSHSDDFLATQHAIQAQRLANCGADLILIETMGTIREACIAVNAAKKTGLTTWVSFVCNATGQLLSGESITDAVRAVLKSKTDGILLNCLPATEAANCFQKLVDTLNQSNVSDTFTRGVYANTGRMVVTKKVGMKTISWESTEAKEPEIYGQEAAKWRQAGANVIGACCGATPEHIRAVVQSLQ